MPSYKITSSVITSMEDDGEIRAVAKNALEKGGFEEVQIISIEPEREWAYV